MYGHELDKIGDPDDYPGFADLKTCWMCSNWSREWVSKASSDVDHWAKRGRCSVTGDLTAMGHPFTKWCNTFIKRKGPLSILKRGRSGDLVPDHAGN